MPTITTKTLRKWRKEALQELDNLKSKDFPYKERIIQLNEQILVTTQILLDTALIKGDYK